MIEFDSFKVISHAALADHERITASISKGIRYPVYTNLIRRAAKITMRRSSQPWRHRWMFVVP